MNRSTVKAWLGLIQLVAAMLLCLLLPAWSLRYWQAWLYVGVFGGSAAAITIYLQRQDPELLERRVTAGPAAEKARTQQIIQTVASLAFVGILVVPGVDHRLHWSAVPTWLVILGNGLVLVGFAVVFATFRENSYASATIDTVKGQRVIATGPYAVVRHPMYAGALVLLAGTPLALGSYWGLVVLLPILVALVWRLSDEERLLTRDLPGYAAYKAQVRYRLMPGLW